MCVLVVCVFGINNLAFVDERKAGEKNDDAFDLMKNEKKNNYRGRRRPGFGLIDSVLREKTTTTTKEEIMNEVEEMKYERPSDESSSEDSGGGAFGDIEEEEEEEEVGKEKDESAKEIDTPSTTTTMDEVKEKEEEKPTDVATKELEIKEEEQREQPAAASSVERVETKGEAPREEGDEREQRIAEDDQTPKSFVDFTAKDLEDVERFDYMMQKRDGSIGLSKNQCQEVKTYFQETLKPRYEDLKTNRIVIIDWSENYQNGIGDEMQHYQELFIIGVSTGERRTSRRKKQSATDWASRKATKLRTPKRTRM